MDLSKGGIVTNGSSLATTALIEGFVAVSAAAGGAVTVTNFGTLSGTSGTSVAFGSASDRLIVEASSDFIGSVAGGGGTLELANGVGTIAGLGGTGTLSGAEAVTFSGFGGYQIDAGGTWTLSGANTLGAGDHFTDNAGMTLAVGASLTVNNTATAQFAGAVINDGVIAAVSTGGLTDLKVLGPGATLTGGGTVTLTPQSRLWGTATTAILTNADNTISGSGWLGLSKMTLVNQAKGVIEATGSHGLLVNMAGATSTNAGIIESAAGSTLTLQSSTLDQSGGGDLAALSGGHLLLKDDVIVGGTISQAGTGSVMVNLSGGEFSGGAGGLEIVGVVQVLNGVALTLAGAIDNTGKLNTQGQGTLCKLIVGAGGVSLTGHGQVNLLANLNNEIVGAASGDTLTNVDNRVSGGGQIGAGTMTLVNQTKGIIIGTGSVALTIDTGAQTVVNAGLIESAAAGALVVKSALSNTGVVFADHGTLTLDGVITGAGSGHIGAGVLNLAAACAETEVFIAGSTGQLRLTDWSGFTGKVQGLSLSGDNTINLTAFTLTGAKASYSGTTTAGVLTVSNATQTATIHLIGNYTASSWSLTSDSHGGVIVKDPPAALLTQTMAMFQSGPAPGLVAPTLTRAPALPVIHAQV